MADYWKSIPRKFCEFCKCWLTDNKPSIEFHERGRRHQENVKRKIGELRKKGKKEFTAQRKLNMQMAKINEAAMKAFQKDLVRDPVLVKQLQAPSSFSSAGPSYSHNNLEIQDQNKETTELVFPGGKKKSKTQKKALSWIEGKDETGRKYYWNTETEESTWEPPAEGYVSLFEQQMQLDEPTQSTPFQPTFTSPEAVTSTCSTGEEDTSVEIKKETYGQWVPITQSREQVVDLQLPDKPETITQLIPNEKEVPAVKFKEKVIKVKVEVKEEEEKPEIIFKKRKINDSKRNVRKRLED